jgi:hypothetical protein
MLELVEDTLSSHLAERERSVCQQQELSAD